jgi:hypothetical protein
MISNQTPRAHRAVGRIPLTLGNLGVGAGRGSGGGSEVAAGLCGAQGQTRSALVAVVVGLVVLVLEHVSRAVGVVVGGWGLAAAPALAVVGGALEVAVVLGGLAAVGVLDDVVAVAALRGDPAAGVLAVAVA